MKRMPMTRFFCQELLYDYVTGQLTPERKAEVDAFLKSDDVCREDLMRVKKAMVYCQNLSTIRTPNEWAERWRNLPPALAKRISNLELRVFSKLWSALPYTVSVVILVLGMVIFKPWRTLMNREVVVWSAANSGTAIVAATATEPASAPLAVVLPEKKEEPVKEEPVKVAAVEVAKPVVTPLAESKETKEAKEALLKSEELGPPERIEDVATTTIFGPPRETAAAVVPTPAVAATIPKEDKDEEDEKPASLREAAKGELYRWFLDTEDFDDVTDEIKEKIIALNGEKARKVELGWHSKDDESYFHFTLPESNRDDLIKYIKSFGPVRMLKEKHPVVMPAGKIRIILILKETAAKKVKPAQIEKPAEEQSDDDDDQPQTPEVP
jgi:anti-sigma factor RsiW